eukprot:Sspe_Gene.117434::Locus_108608_Transcript_2_2_Confidence_0.750_Length_584::g.117434::m.117434/K03858/PIGH, GPI15; phosphatidylinositol glycan, class H
MRRGAVTWHITYGGDGGMVEIEVAAPRPVSLLSVAVPALVVGAALGVWLGLLAAAAAVALPRGKVVEKVVAVRDVGVQVSGKFLACESIAGIVLHEAIVGVEIRPLLAIILHSSTSVPPFSRTLPPLPCNIDAYHALRGVLFPTKARGCH